MWSIDRRITNSLAFVTILLFVSHLTRESSSEAMKLKPLLVCIIAIGLVVVSHGLADDVKRRFPAMALNNWRTDDRAAIAAWTNNRLNSVQSQPSGCGEYWL
jgi:hypothetical protein